MAVTSSGALCVNNSGVHSEGAESVTGSERVNGGRKPRVESGYFSLEKPKPESQQQHEHHKQPPSSSSSRLRYSTSDPALFVSSSSHDTHMDLTDSHTLTSDTPTHTSDTHTSHSPPTGTQGSPLSSSQSSLDSETSPERRRHADTVGGDMVSEARGVQARLLRDGRSYAALSDVPRARRLNHRQAFRPDERRQEMRARTRSPGREEVERLFGHQRRRTQVIERFETQQSSEVLDHMDTAEVSLSSSKPTSQRTGRSDRRFPSQKQDLSLDSSIAGTVTDFSGKMDIYRRAKSLDRRVTESSMTPDLLNFKKGWMTKLYEDGLWKKHWFVLTDQSLRYYRDSIAEEAADLDGEIDLSTCYDVTEFPVQRNYGFQIHSQEGVFTLSAMTSGIRRNWIQAIMKSVRPTITPDVTRKNIPLKLSVLKPSSVSDENAKSTPSPPDTSRSSWRSCDVITDSSQPPDRHKPRPRDRRRDGRSKTFDWAEFQNKKTENPDLSSSPPPSSVSSSTSSPSSSHSDRKLTPQEQEVNSPKGRVGAASESPSAEKNSEVQVKIEQSWHQVETTPLREEKQVPITGGSAHFSTKDKIPTQEFTALMDKESQKELVKLQEQNTLLQEQLQGAQHTAREGYVLQSAEAPGKSSPNSSSNQPPWQRLNKLNMELKTELEAQRQKHDLAHQQVSSLKRSYSEAQDRITNHEVEIEALQAKLASAMVEIVASEQAVACMRSELKLEQSRCREREEEQDQNEKTLRSQLRDNEERLRDVEAKLLEKTQALRILEQQQALQRDQHKEVQRLQEKLTEVTGRLIATEEAQALREERERKEQQCLEDKLERERQGLNRRLAESEEQRLKAEEQLQEALDQIEALLRGTSGDRAGSDIRMEMLHLQQDLNEQSDLIENLRESIRSLEEERNGLTCRCQELVNQIAEADREVGKLQTQLKTEESDYYSLERSYNRVSEEFGRISRILREKEEDIQQTKETYEKLMRQKDQDLTEALVKMAALGNSLEETEHRLKAREELLGQMGHGEVENTLKEKLAVAENRITELEQNLDTLHLEYADLRIKRCPSQQDILDAPDDETYHDDSSSAPSLFTLTRSSSETEVSFAKRQRIRFSNIQCQKYHQSQGIEKILMENPSLNLTQEDFDTETSLTGDYTQDFSQDIISLSDDSLQYCSGAPKHTNIIQSLESKLQSIEQKMTDMTARKQNNQDQLDYVLPMDVCSDKSCTEPDQYEPNGSLCLDVALQHSTLDVAYIKALIFVESCRASVGEILSCHREGSSTETQVQTLSKIQKDLSSATLLMRQAKTQDPASPAHESQSEINKHVMKMFAKMLAFEGNVLQKMSIALQDPNSDVMRSLREIQKDAGCRQTGVYTDILVRKLLVENLLVNDLDKYLSQQTNSTNPLGYSPFQCNSAVNNACVNAELAYILQTLKHTYQGESEATGLDSDTVSSDLAPHMQQIEREEALSLAENIVIRHLAEAMQPCCMESGTSARAGQESLITELTRQSEFLLHLSQQVEKACEEDTSALLYELASRIQELWLPRVQTPNSVFIYEALSHVQVAYVACRLRSDQQRQLLLCQETRHRMASLVQEHAQHVADIERQFQSDLEKERQNYSKTVNSLQEENQTLQQEAEMQIMELQEQREHMTKIKESFEREMLDIRRKHSEELSQIEQKHSTNEQELLERAANSQTKLETLLQEVEGAELRNMEHIRELELDFHLKVEQLENTHEEEIKKLHERYSQTILTLGKRFETVEEDAPHPSTVEVQETGPMMEQQRSDQDVSRDSMTLLRSRVQELELQMMNMRDELENKPPDGDTASLKEKYQRDFDSLKETCERGFAAMEETHQKVIGDLQRQHQREINKLHEERERLLEEETNATIAAIEAMRNAHREELEKTQRALKSGVSADIEELRIQYEEELQSIHRELEVLSEQYSQKCLENSHLAQALEAERQALQQCQRENQQLHTHNQELNNRLTVEITRMRSCLSGEKPSSTLTQGKDLYELEVLLRIKESEIQYLKQEINSLKDELQSALRDKKYASDKYKDIYTELSIVRAKADCDISKLREKLLAATEAFEERDASTHTPGYDIMKSKSNPDFLKKERSTLSKQVRGGRSKSLMEGLTVQERMKLFEAKDPRKI